MVERYRNRDCRDNSRKTASMNPTKENSLMPNPSNSRQSNCQGNNSCSNGNGCSGGNGCQALLRRLQVLDFSIVDTVLYLDAYPHCAQALAHYHSLVSERDALKKKLAQQCKTPITSYENESRDSWDWINNPWPWEIGANE